MSWICWFQGAAALSQWMFLDGLPQSCYLLQKSCDLEEVNYVLRSKFKFETKKPPILTHLPEMPLLFLPHTLNCPPHPQLKAP